MNARIEIGTSGAMLNLRFHVRSSIGRHRSPTTPQGFGSHQMQSLAHASSRHINCDEKQCVGETQTARSHEK
jgi:hypothetical protein